MGFKPTFVVTVTADEISHGDTVKNQPYASAKDALITREGRADCRRTVMAFGPNAEILARLPVGKPVRLSVRHSDAMLQFVGIAKDEAAVG